MMRQEEHDELQEQQELLDALEKGLLQPVHDRDEIMAAIREAARNHAPVSRQQDTSS